MSKEIFFEECDIVSKAYALLEVSQEIPRQDFINLLNAYEKLLNQTVHITNISDMLSKNLNQYKHELLSKVNVDELTNVNNRRHLLVLLDRYFGECTRMGSCISAIMIDIDCFKNYNDRYGHISGDICLKNVASAVSKSIHHPNDFVARYGGEEFYAVLPYTPLSGAKKVADRIKQNIAALRMPHEDSRISEYVTVSMGVSALIPTPCSKIVSLLETCDAALYEAKAAGRNCVVTKELIVPSFAECR